MRSPTVDPMTRDERRAGLGLASVFALRMFGLFLILPVFSVYAKTLPSGNDATLVGLGLGAYGLTQACLQIAYGAASDRFGRKPVIVFGLILFAAGSLVAAVASDIHGIIAGRALQGAGAISAAVTALAADLTRAQHLTKVMAMIGSSIGLVFALSMVGAPLLYAGIGMSGLFVMTGVLSVLAIGVVLLGVPAAPTIPRPPERGLFGMVLVSRPLLQLNFGVFVLHLVQTAMWVVLPSRLVEAGGLPVGAHWKVYLPAVLASIAFMVPAVIAAERRGRMKGIFLGAVALLLVVQLGFAFFGDGLFALSFWLFLFFVAFNVLEATQPSLISRLAPPHAKGAALGVYNTTQSLGLFLGGVTGGALAHHGGVHWVWLGCAAAVVLWGVLSLSMSFPVLATGAATSGH